MLPIDTGPCEPPESLARLWARSPALCQNGHAGRITVDAAGFSIPSAFREPAGPVSGDLAPEDLTITRRTHNDNMELSSKRHIASISLTRHRRGSDDVRRDLRGCRIERFLSQRELARQAGLHAIALVRLEAGATTPSTRTVRALASALGVSRES